MHVCYIFCYEAPPTLRLGTILQTLGKNPSETHFGNLLLSQIIFDAITQQHDSII